MTDKEMWLVVRRALMMVVKAIEQKYMKDNGQSVPLEVAKDTSISLVVDE